ncbi:hypothetical protein FOMPIDRAFT_112416 [Fomitopsis schrenkii]|uniref:Zn(2)-C6 fungal-type domain-containing protein n=1 Tax=Fomitopsis schrenkii TaxID=2126942 RepID=S8FV75_FOMSC|nr:hypothetical protein FOMPIDRAFT_112416 [Fomitopsis schrenkii]
MSGVEPTVRKKRSASDAVKQRTTPEDDHRRKRRNRTTQSCLNCHTSKRMCDRKRPCGRCTQLGLTGLCVYEVDDPSRRQPTGDSQDEKCRLQKRVAELESVIRERTGLEDSFFSEIWDRLVPPGGSCDSARVGEHCGCLNDPATYNAILELSLRLRRAADVLGRSTHHAPGTSNCMINQNILELDRFTSTALGNISAPPDPFGTGSHPNRATLPASTTAPTTYTSAFEPRPMPGSSAAGVTVSPPLLQSQSVKTWDYKPTTPYPSPPWEDPFMSWMPQQRRTRLRNANRTVAIAKVPTPALTARTHPKMWA